MDVLDPSRMRKPWVNSDGNLPARYTNPTADQCPMCNNCYHTKNNCLFNDKTKYGLTANFENVPWNESKVGKRFKDLGYFNTLPMPPEHYIKMSKGDNSAEPNTASHYQHKGDLN